MKRFFCCLIVLIIAIMGVCFATEAEEGTMYLYMNESGELVPIDDLGELGDATLIDSSEGLNDLYEDTRYASDDSEAKAGFDEQLTYLTELQADDEYEKLTVVDDVSEVKTEFQSNYYYGYYFAAKYQTAMVRDEEGNEFESVIILSFDVLDNNNIKPIKVGDSFYGYKDVVSSSDENYYIVNHDLDDSQIAIVYVAEQDRSLGVIFLVVLAIVLMVLYAGKDGAKYLLAIFVAVDLLFIVFVPYITLGKNIILLASLIALELIVLICVSKNGWKKRTLCAIIASIVSVVLVAALALFFVYTNRITGGSVINERATINSYYVQNVLNNEINTSNLYVAMIILISSVIASVIASKYAELIERYAGSKKMVDNIINEAKTSSGDFVMMISIVFLVLAMPKFMSILLDQTNLVQILNSETLITYLSIMLFTIISGMIAIPVLAVIGNLFMGNVEVKKIDSKK